MSPISRSRSEDRRQETELLVEKQNRKIAENERKIEEMSKTVSQVDQLRDQLEEFNHTEEKLHKMENAIEKYKKRLEDSADLRRQIMVGCNRNEFSVVSKLDDCT
jgi:protein HOOK3